MVNEKGYIEIPSEMIEDKLPAILADWLQEYGAERLNFEQLKERMTGIWWFLSKNGSIHAQIAWNNETGRIERMERKGLLKKICKKVNSL